jgi:hypothetical protein
VEPIPATSEGSSFRARNLGRLRVPRSQKRRRRRVLEERIPPMAKVSKRDLTLSLKRLSLTRKEIVRVERIRNRTILNK